MSRIGTRRITIPDAVTVNLEGTNLQIKGPKGEASVAIHPRVSLEQDSHGLKVKRSANDRIARSLHGLTQVLIQNAVNGVTHGFTKRLELQGIGYRAQTDGRKLTLNVGYTQPVIIEAPEAITFSVEKTTLITVTGIDKQQVGQIAANIRSVRKPEPYKGKGIRYVGELVRRKAGKAAKAGK